TVTSTVTLLQAARQAGVKRLVQAGSSSVYGDSEILPKREDMLPQPLSPYAAAKISQEYYAAAFSRSLGIDTVTLRYFNVFGPRQDPASEYAAVIPKFISLMLAGESPLIYGDGLQSRDFTYIDNVVEGNLRAALRPEPFGGEAINLACGDRFTLLELVATVNRLLGTDIKPRHGEPRPGDVRHSQADISKARRLLGFAPLVTFEEGLRRTVAWHRQKVKGKSQ
ncbi:MAG: NAD-dependent epimerase/dehydratase family protein, partial [Planctomycetota bacterium]|nr:NAD-dependent epimerase/dehydratase family protein [Planctomycetota bacterium]